MQDSSEGQCKRETVYSCQIEDGFVLCLADTSEVPIARLIWVLSDTQQAAYSAASAAGALYPSASSLLSPIATGACSLLCLLTPAHQLCHFHFPILCIPAPFSAHNPFLLPGQWVYLPAPPQTLHFLSFSSGTSVMQGVPGVVFCSTVITLHTRTEMSF